MRRRLCHAGFASRVFTTFRFARPQAAILAGMYTVLGAYVASDGHIRDPGRVVRAAITIGLIVVFGFVINDYHDAGLDRVSKPYRAIPSGRVSGQMALLLAGIAAGLAVLVGATIDLRSGAVALALVLVSGAYSYVLKPTLLLGIATVALLNVAAVLYGCMAVDALSPAARVLLMFAFLNAGAQETLYNLEDRAEDVRYGIRTTAVRLGPEATLGVFSVLALGCAAATLVPWVIHIGSVAYLWAALPCSTLPLVGIVIFVQRERTQESYCAAHRMMRFLRISSVLPVLLLI